MLRQVLGELQGIPGVLGSALVAEDGFIVESTGAELGIELDFLGGPAATALASARALAQELQRGEIEEVMVEYARGPLLMVPVKNYFLLLLLDSVHSLGKVRFQLKRNLPQIMELL
jgi:predicted regulator of Ras-like GTPase activity (Roadblock/LC7/MglB family)